METDALRRRLKARLDALIDQALASQKSPRTIEEVEALAVELGQRAREEIAAELAENAKTQAQPKAVSKIRCACGRWARYKGERWHEVVTMAGEVRVSRAYYYCRGCDAGICPADRVLGLGPGCFTRRVCQEAARLGSLMAFAPGVALFWEWTGVQVSAKHAQRLTAEAGAVAAEYLACRQEAAFAQRARPERSVDVLYLEADGVQTPMVAGWRETKIGLARGIDRAGNPVGPTEYVSFLGNCEPFGERWYALGVYAGLETARLVVALGDGAAWIWNQASLHFPGAIQIVDCWHALERLWELGRAAFGVGSVAAATWVAACKEQLLSGRWNQLGEALRELAQEHPGVSEAVAQTLGYYENNRERMDYPRYRALGLQIGSGAAESGCKQVVTQRLKGAGMRWTEAGAQGVAQLRCLLLGGQWADFRAYWNRTCSAMV
jgi:hypothetical protein